MMKKQTVVDQIEVQRDGTLGVRFAKEVVDDDGAVLTKEWHRTALPPGHDIAMQMAMINQHLTTELKCAPVGDECVARIQAHAQTAWTPEVIQRHQEKMQAEAAAIAERVRRAQEEQEAKDKAEAEATTTP